MESEFPRSWDVARAAPVVEHTLSWFNNYRCMRLCYERNGEHLQALHDLAAAILCANRLAPGP